MSARTKVAKSLQVGAYAPVVFQPSANGEHIKRAVTELGLTGVTICGETVTADALQPKTLTNKLPGEFINLQAIGGMWYVDWVTPTKIQTLYSKVSWTSARAYAKRTARRLGLTVHEGPYVWEAAT